MTNQATIQHLTSNVVGEEPFIGDLKEGERFVNTADGREWVGDSIGSPIELGGAVKNNPIGRLRSSNYLSVDISQAENLPVPNTNPENIPPGFYRENRILISFSESPTSLSVYFDYPINWGPKDFWFVNSIVSGEAESDNPIDAYKGAGREILIELSAFGPSSEWMGRILWINNI